MPQIKYTAIMGGNREAVTSEAGDAISDGPALEVNVDFGAATTAQEVARQLDNVKARLLESWPAA